MSLSPPPTAPVISTHTVPSAENGERVHQGRRTAEHGGGRTAEDSREDSMTAGEDGNSGYGRKAFQRAKSHFADRITADGRDGYPVEAGRYRLVAARACPWANRAIIVRRLLGLEQAISMGLCGPTHDQRSWTFDLDPGGVDPVLGYERLQQAYFARFPDYPRGITVPAIVEVPTGQLVTNDFPQITLDFSTEWVDLHRE